VASTRTSASGLVEITDREFELFRRLILEESGISLSDHKRPLLCARLGRRLRQLSLSSYSEYYEYLRTRDTTRAERRELINSITTNKTNFFRESHHFDFLREHVLAPLARSAAQGGQRRLRIWSAACSTGEEPYSLAMTVASTLSPLAEWDVRILASDIDTEVLARAERGVYPRESAEEIPLEHRRRWCLLQGDELEVDPALRQLVTFREINFVREPWPIRVRFDVIFCRNVMIYFDRDKQTRIYTRFHELLRPNGFLVAGHSENLMFMAPLFEPLGNTVYKRRTTGRSRRSLEMVAVAPARAERPLPSRSLPASAAGSGQGGARIQASKRPAHASLVPRERSRPSHPARQSGGPRSSRGSEQGPQRVQERSTDTPARPRRRSLRPRVSGPPKSRSKAPSVRARTSASPESRSKAPSVRARTSASPESRSKAASPRSPHLPSTAPMSAPVLNIVPLAGPASGWPDGTPMAVTTPPGGARDGIERRRIQSGELFASSSPALVSTLLGSCVSACVFDAGCGVGGMNHFMLPSGDADGAWNAMCFGTNAMELLINELLRLGARRGQLCAHVFGAAHVLGAGVQADVAIENERFIRQFMARERIALSTQALGGEQPLLVSFETHTGRASARAIGEKSREVAEADARLRASLERRVRPLDDGVTLF
jgi:chemotaxis protein methyltransferase CheR